MKLTNMALSDHKCVLSPLSIMMSTVIVRVSAGAAVSEGLSRQVKVRYSSPSVFGTATEAVLALSFFFCQGACPSLAPPFAKQSSVAWLVFLQFSHVWPFSDRLPLPLRPFACFV